MLVKYTYCLGDDSLESALKEGETLCMDQVYDSLDWYKKAVIETREIEVHCTYATQFSFVFCYIQGSCNCFTNLIIKLYTDRLLVLVLLQIFF